MPPFCFLRRPDSEHAHDDFDNVVLAITHTLVVADPGPAIVLHFDAASFPVCLSVERCALTLCPLDWFEGRAPPVA